jgi:hypothetical protein
MYVFKVLDRLCKAEMERAIGDVEIAMGRLIDNTGVGDIREW